MWSARYTPFFRSIASTRRRRNQARDTAPQTAMATIPAVSQTMVAMAIGASSGSATVCFPPGAEPS